MNAINLKQQINIRFSVKNCKSASETVALLKMAYGERAMND